MQRRVDNNEHCQECSVSELFRFSSVAKKYRRGIQLECAFDLEKYKYVLSRIILN